jgi:hypothetical protein
MKQEHIDDIDCWCKPTIYFTSGKCNVLLHYGDSGETPTPGMLVAAIRLCVQNDNDGKYGNVSIEPKSESEGE